MRFDIYSSTLSLFLSQHLFIAQHDGLTPLTRIIGTFYIMDVYHYTSG